MSIYIKSATLNEFDGALQQTINFVHGLNIISGENGTGKTTVIKKIKEYVTNNNTNLGFQSDDAAINQPNQLSVFVLNPKRNSEKQAISQTFNNIRSQNKTFEAFLSTIKDKQITDNTYDTYPSFAELYGVYFDSKNRDGSDQKIKMDSVTFEFNEVLNKVFPNYKIVSDWDSVSGKPDVKLKINGLNPLSLEKLSCGQQEVLSLLFNVYVSREKYNVYLIDEPEIHLNWNLEKGLFNFFEWFCNKYNRQLIVITHSRVIFKDPFYSKTKFLVWDVGKIVYQSDISESQKDAIVGELAETVQVIAPTSKTFFVEDELHEFVIKKIAEELGKNIVVVQAGNSTNVKTFFNLSKNKTSAWQQNGYYLVDGDNQGNPFEGESRFIHLERYSIESYLFNLELLSKILGKEIANIQKDLLDSIKSKKTEIFNKGKNARFGEKLLDKILSNEITEDTLKIFDCSQILEEFAQKQGKSAKNIFEDYIKKAKEENKLNTIFDDSLLNAINQ